jgi:opacity protein-like surface antigen
MSLSLSCNMRKVTGTIALVVTMLSSPAQASSFTDSWNNWWIQKTWRPIATVGVGSATSSSVGQSQSFPIVNPATDEFYFYSAYRPNQTSVFVDAFLGAEWRLNEKWLVQGGLSYTGASAFSAKGTFLQGADLQSADTYNYSYNILERQLLVQSKLLYTFMQRYHPYGVVGIGSAFNRAYNFQTSVPSTITFTREYNDSTTISLAYLVGLGIDVDITNNWRLGIGYRFADLGSTSFGGTSIGGTNVSGTISQTHSYNNIGLLEVSWLQ